MDNIYGMAVNFSQILQLKSIFKNMYMCKKLYYKNPRAAST